MKSDKREHHNLLERRRRDHIKDSFYDLRDCLPQLRGEKVCVCVYSLSIYVGSNCPGIVSGFFHFVHGHGRGCQLSRIGSYLINCDDLTHFTYACTARLIFLHNNNYILRPICTIPPMRIQSR